MVNLVDYKLLGYSSFDEYIEDFFKTLLKTIQTYNFFVDWQKVKSKAMSHIVELGLLNSLTLKKNRKEKKRILSNILKEHPKVMSIIPVLLAIREQSIEVAEISQQVIYKHFDFRKTTLEEKQIKDAVLFFEKTGLLDLFDGIKDVYTYVLGVEVGLDTNARKNRSGKVFSQIMEYLLSNTLNQLKSRGYELSYEKEVQLSMIIKEFKRKKVDFLVFKDKIPLIVCEANIYHGPGSKPLEVARAYVALKQQLKNKGMNFIWFTDGPGWRDMHEPLREAAESIDFILNYSIANRVLEKLLLSMLK